MKMWLKSTTALGPLPFEIPLLESIRTQILSPEPEERNYDHVASSLDSKSETQGFVSPLLKSLAFTAKSSVND